MKKYSLNLLQIWMCGFGLVIGNILYGILTETNIDLRYGSYVIFAYALLLTLICLLTVAIRRNGSGFDA